MRPVLYDSRSSTPAGGEDTLQKREETNVLANAKLKICSIK